MSSFILVLEREYLTTSSCHGSQKAPFLLLTFENSLGILDTSSLSDMCAANTFFEAVACLFIYLTVCFEEEKLKYFINYGLLIFSFIDCVFGVVSKTALPDQVLKDFSTVFSFRRFIVLGFLYFCLWSNLK